MQAKTRTAAVLLIGALLATGCANRTAQLPGTSTDVRSAPTETTTTTTPTTTMAGATAPEAELVEPAGLPATTSTTTTTTTTVLDDPAIAEIDSLLAGLDETLAELDQLINQAAAALAAEEGEILP